MDMTPEPPRFRGPWAIPVAFLASATAAMALAVLEVTGVVIVVTTGELDVLAQAFAKWILPTALKVVLPSMIFFGLPTWMMMHLFRSLHPGLGALVGGVVGAGVAALAAVMLLGYLAPAHIVALFGLPPGAAAGAICLWIAYQPKP